jgi:hypothetical protein
MEVAIIVLLVLAALAAVLYPILTGRSRPAPPPEVAQRARARPRQAGGAAARERGPAGGSSAAAPASAADADTEAEVRRYRVALRAGTLCRRCAEANEPGARFCTRCGKPLPAAADAPAGEASAEA